MRQIRAKFTMDVSLMDTKLLEQIHAYYRLLSLWLVRVADPQNTGCAELLLVTSRLHFCFLVYFAQFLYALDSSPQCFSRNSYPWQRVFLCPWLICSSPERYLAGPPSVAQL